MIPIAVHENCVFLEQKVIDVSKDEDEMQVMNYKTSDDDEKQGNDHVYYAEQGNNHVYYAEQGNDHVYYAEQDNDLAYYAEQ